jgi:hypothetical protein
LFQFSGPSWRNTGRARGTKVVQQANRLLSAQQEEFPDKPSAYELEELRSADLGEKAVSFFITIQIYRSSTKLCCKQIIGVKLDYINLGIKLI